MYRKLTARKSTTLVNSAIDKSGFNPAYTVHRADIDPMVARKQAIRLLATYTFLWLPVHCGICWLASYSLGLAATAVIVTAAAAFAVALAKWLGLEDLLQKLPLIIILGFVLAGLVLFTSQANLKWLAGIEFIVAVLILTSVISILGGLYRPLTAAYQAITLKTPFQDLCVAGVAMLVSLGLAALVQIVPQFGFAILICTVAGGFGGFVVLEYAGWAQANPNVSLERALAFTDPTAAPGKRALASTKTDYSGTAISGAALFGFGCGILAVLHNHHSSPSPRLYRFCLIFVEKEPEKVNEVLALFFALSLVAVPFGLCLTADALNAIKLVNPLSGLHLAWDALVVFLTYSETNHPLVHKLQTPWLRPLAVRIAVTGLALVTVATAAFLPSEELAAVDLKAKPVAKAPPPPPPARPKFDGPQDAAVAEILGIPRDNFPDGPVGQPGKDIPARPVGQPFSGANVAKFALDALALVVIPPAFIYAMIWLVGLTVLPTYFNYFEKPQS